MDPNLFTLMDLDAQSLIGEVMEGDPTSFVEATSAILDVGTNSKF